MKIEFEDRVKETTTSTGTGNKVLAGAVAGFQSFADALPSGGYFCYEIHAVDAGGLPNGDWEVGIGYLNSGNLASVKILSSSNAGEAVSFTAGAKEVNMTAPALSCRSLRLEEQMIIYASPATGADYYDGLSSDRPLDTLQAAVDAAVALASTNAGDVVVRLLDNSSDGAYLPYSNRGNGGGVVRIQGLNSSVSVGSPISATNSGSGWQIESITLSGWSSCLIVEGDSRVTIASGVSFEETTESQIIVRNGGRLVITNGCTIKGGSTGGAHIDVESASYAKIGGSVSFSTDCDFDLGFVRSLGGLGYIDVSDANYQLNGHTVTGQRYNLNGNGVCWTNGESSTFLPGDSAGAETNGAKYL